MAALGDRILLNEEPLWVENGNSRFPPRTRPVASLGELLARAARKRSLVVIGISLQAQGRELCPLATAAPQGWKRTGLADWRGELTTVAKLTIICA
jgi:hypothetical protein